MNDCYPDCMEDFYRDCLKKAGDWDEVETYCFEYCDGTEDDIESTCFGDCMGDYYPDGLKKFD